MLAGVAATTALLIVAACRLEAMARIAAVGGVLLCLVAWVVLLEFEGRAAAQLEDRLRRRPAARRNPVRRAGSRSPDGRKSRARRVA